MGFDLAVLGDLRLKTKAEVGSPSWTVHDGRSMRVQLDGPKLRNQKPLDGS